MGQCWHCYIFYGEGLNMKLSKYIRHKLDETWPRDGIPPEDIINSWIVEWYKEIYERDPPMWLAGETWHQRRSVKNEKV